MPFFLIHKIQIITVRVTKKTCQNSKCIKSKSFFDPYLPIKNRLTILNIFNNPKNNMPVKIPLTLPFSEVGKTIIEAHNKIIGTIASHPFAICNEYSIHTMLSLTEYVSCPRKFKILADNEAYPNIIGLTNCLNQF